MSIKKAYTELHTLLKAAKAEGNISQSVFDKAVALMSAKAAGGTSGSSFIKNAEGVVVAIRCYYFKRWMPLIGALAVEFGKKATSTTGFNSMCKEGNSLWTKQLATFKKAKEQTMSDVIEGKIKPEDAKVALEKLEAARHAIAKTELGFASEKDVEAYLASPEAKAKPAPKAEAAPKAETAKVAPKAETAKVAPKAETAKVAPKAETAKVAPKAK